MNDRGEGGAWRVSTPDGALFNPSPSTRRRAETGDDCPGAAQKRGERARGSSRDSGPGLGRATSLMPRSHLAPARRHRNQI